MAATIQTILKPTRARGLDTSSGEHFISQELITNGTFASDISVGWVTTSSGGSAAPTIGSGVLTMNSDGSDFSRADQSFSTVIGGVYKLSIDKVTTTVLNQVKVGTSRGASDNLSEDVGAIQTYSFYFTATATTSWLRIEDGGASAGGSYDNISIKRVESFGNNNHAQIYSGRALEFDGVTDYLVADGVASLADSDFTAAIWIKPTLDGYTEGPGGRVLFSFHDGSNNNRLIVFIAGASTGSGGSTGVANSLKTFTASNLNTASTAGALSGSWERIVLVKQGNSIQTYRNGVADGTITMADTISGCAKFSIGQEWDSAVASDFYLGMMSDFQIWNSVWTADDVTYDYLNPEQLALNRGGTLLTNSNLKLWYPMNEGHRGNQSYILDASNTGLGDDLVNWSSTFNASGTSTDDFGDWTTNANDSTTFCTWDHDNKTIRLRSTDGTHIQAFYSPDILKEGIIYKFEYTISELISGSVRIRPEDNADYTVHTEAGTYSYLTTPADGNDLDFRIERNLDTGPNDFTISDVKIYPINDKNNATTVFYGDEQITDPKNRTGFASHDWVHYNSASGNLNVSSSKLFITCNSSAGAADNQGAQLAIASVDAAGGSYPIVAGRTYRVQADLDFTTIADSDLVVKFALGNESEVITASDGAPENGLIDATEQTYYADITTADATGNLRINCTAATNDSESDNIFSVDNVSVKEVGTAMGWTDADQQLDIPQTALQSYNQLAWFDGAADYVSIADHNDFSFGSGSADEPFSVSAWIFINDISSSFPVIAKYGSGSSREWVMKVGAVSSADGKLAFLTFEEDPDAYIGRRYDTSLSSYVGQWIHVAGTKDDTEVNSGFAIYINGEKVDDEDHDDGSYTGTGNGPSAVTIGFSHTGNYANGCITEACIWDKELSATEVTELYNNGLALDATTHSASPSTGTDYLIGYWRNNGLATWQDLTANDRDGTPTSITETMLITAGADGSRDSQGFLMNRQRLTNCINGLHTGSSGGGNYTSGVVVQDSSTLDITGAFTIGCWFKLKDFDHSYNLIQKKTAWNSAGYGIYIHKDTKKPYLEWSNGSDIQQASESDNATDTLDVWYFVYAVHDPDGLHNSSTGVDTVYSAKTTDTSLSRNQQIAMHAGSIDGAVGTNDLPLTIGQNYGGGQAVGASIHFTGEIDDVVIYNGALSPEQVLRNFKAGKRSHR